MVETGGTDTADAEVVVPFKPKEKAFVVEFETTAGKDDGAKSDEVVLATNTEEGTTVVVKPVVLGLGCINNVIVGAGEALIPLVLVIVEAS